MMDCACIGPSLKFASVIAADSGPVLHRLCRQRCCATFLAAAVGRREEKSSGDRLHPGGKMTVGAGISIVDGNLMVLGRPVLSRLPDGVILTPHLTSDSWHSAFLGSSALEPSSRHVFSIGTLQGLRFMCGFRFKLWWMTQRMGDCGRDVPMETQFLLLESKALSPSSPHGHLDDLLTVYTVFLPLLEGSFRASLQGSDLDELQLCVESGDAAVESSEARHALFVGVGTDPFAIISEAVRAVEEHSQSFLHREKKKMPGMLDCFGWCTWDAFYTHVTADGVNEGLRSLSEGGTPARFLIIDDGWQSVDTDKGVNAAVTEGTQYASRLSSIRANHKFDERGEEASCLGLQRLIEKAKDDFNLEYVYMWHALAGYWGGVQLNSQEMEQYQPVLTHPVHSPGILFNQPDMAVDSLTVNGLGLVDPQKIYDFYNDLHSYLAKAGVSGVKVDSQSIIETLGQGSGGRVSLAKTYIQALEASIARNFPDNGCISCMSHSSDTIYSTKQTAVIRASDDFWPQDPASHTIHIASVTYNSLFLGEFMQPDWDMFQSLHPAAAYHAAARAVGGCAVYVSDRPGQHDFELLRKLVLPDGTVLRAKLPGRPTLDSIFVDPARDKTSLLKIWNMNSWTGVLGVFNCQGAGWCKVGKKNLIHDTAPDTITGSIHGCDVHLLGLVADGNWNGDCVVYSHQSEEVVRLPRRSALPVTLKVLEFEVYTITPLKKMESGTCFAPIGLLNMFNSGGGIVDLSYDPEPELHPPASGAGVSCPHSAQTCPANLQVSEFVRMSVRGCGKFGAYSSRKPRGVFFDSKPSEFSYQEDDGLLTFFLPVPVKGHLWDVRVEL